METTGEAGEDTNVEKGGRRGSGESAERRGRLEWQRIVPAGSQSVESSRVESSRVESSRVEWSQEHQCTIKSSQDA